MRIVVLGASGKVGRQVVALLLEKNQEVTAVTHSHNPFKNQPRVTVVKADIHSSNDLEPALKDVDAVISALGSWQTKQKDVLSTATKNIIPIMEKNNISRFISVSGADAEASSDQIGFIHKLTRAAFKVFFKKVMNDAENHILLLEKSNINWTVIRSPGMNEWGSTNKYTLTDKRPLPWQTINRKSVAKAIVEQLDSKEWFKKSPYIKR